MPLTGFSTKNQNIIMFVLSLFFQCDQEITVFWLDGSIKCMGHFEGTILIKEHDLVGSVVHVVPETLEQGTQLSLYNKFILVDKKNNIIRLYMDFVNMDINNVRVFIDGYPTEWDPIKRDFFLDLNNDVTPRVNNSSSLSRDQFTGVTFEVTTNGLPLKHLQYT